VTTATARNGTTSATDLRARGLALCKPDPGEKKPTYRGWSTYSREPGDFLPGDLIGIICGPLSDGNRPGHALIVPDLDAPEALARADAFLPPTGMEEGRPGKERDHRYYLVPVATIPPWAESQARQGAPAARAKTGHPGPSLKHFKHAITKKPIIDFPGTGGQVVCPSDGNQRRWVGDEPGEPAVVPFSELWDAVCKLALACGAKVPDTDEAEVEEEEEPEQPEQPRTHAHNGHEQTIDARMRRRIRAYLAKCDPAVSGQNGHGDTYWPARAVCYGFDLGEELGFKVLWEVFNPRCQPPWTEEELRHKCHDADTLPFRKPRGWLLCDTFDNFTEVEVEKEDANHKTETVRVGRPVQQIAERLADLSGGWPKRTGRLLFVEGPEHAPLWLESTDDLFGWIASLLPGDKANALSWAQGPDKVTQAQFAAYLRQTAEDFEAVEPFPHYPPRPRTYYMHPQLRPTGDDALGGLMERFHPATDADRDLLLAMLLTLAWGGEPGQRPAGLITTEDEGDALKGRGAGKTTVVRVFGRVFGGLVLVDAKEDMAKIKTRLLSAEGRGKRVLLLDNIKSLKFSWAELEAAITSDVISGHQLYVGEGRRPNTFTWFLTINGASMSRDMAQRTAALKVRRADYSGDWESATAAYVEAHRWEIIGDLIEVLKAPGAQLARFSRWAAWEAGVLSRVGDPGEAQRTVAERQADMDEDENEAAVMREAFVEELRRRRHDPDREAIRIPAAVVAEVVSAVTGEKYARNKASALLGTLAIPELRRLKGRTKGRGWEWRGLQTPRDLDMVDINAESAFGGR
jgi:hypothetical protein